MALRILILAPVLAALALPAAAQTALSLSASGVVDVTPDEAEADFNVQSVAPDAASAQAQVNQAVAKALEAAGKLPGVTVTTNGYSSFVSRPDDNSKPQYSALQSITFTEPAKGGVPDKAFTDMLAQLQADGLLLNGLSGNLSRDGQNKAQRDAIRDALGQLRGEAQDIAATLHKKMGALKTLNVNTGGMPVVPMRRMIAVAVASAAPVPESAPEKITVTANVTAEIDLESQ